MGGLNLVQKVIRLNSTTPERPLTVGDVHVVRVARTLASELTLVGIKDCLERVPAGRVRNAANLFLACDHSVDPRNYHEAEVKARIDMCAAFAKKYALDAYKGPNETILHTEFYRQMAEPGTVIVGADSHSCAHGCVGAVAIGMGAGDTALAVLTGHTWLSVPPVVRVELRNRLPFGMCGKDVALWFLKSFGRNTVALEACLEFAGEGASTLAMDDRFTLCNMATEAGALAAVFAPDEETRAFLARRAGAEGLGQAACDAAEMHRLLPDPGAEYAARIEIDLAEVRPTIARYPSPDNVVPLDQAEAAGPVIEDEAGGGEAIPIAKLDGVFIGACTTSEKEMIFAAELAHFMRTELRITPKERAAGSRPYVRRVTPGSREILNRLRAIGALAAFERAGFVVGAPSCSYCLGVGVDRAGPREIWLSSQNRNFKNRMGKGAIGSITSAAAVVASSFGMEITDPQPFIDALATQKAFKFIEPRLAPPAGEASNANSAAVTRHGASRGADAPAGDGSSRSREMTLTKATEMDFAAAAGALAAATPADGPAECAKALPGEPSAEKGRSAAPPAVPRAVPQAQFPEVGTAFGPTIRGRVQRFGDCVDTDAIIPAKYIPLRGAEQGRKAFCIARPTFFDRAQAGRSVVVAGRGFGCGSSREEAVSCLRYAGVQCVIARSFSFIFARNLLTFNLRGVVLDDPRFFDLATEDAPVEVDFAASVVRCGPALSASFPFKMSNVQKYVYQRGGFLEMLNRLVTADGDAGGDQADISTLFTSLREGCGVKAPAPAAHAGCDSTAATCETIPAW